MSEINKWEIMRNLHHNFVSNIKLFYVFGSTADNAIYISNNDKVYAFGSSNRHQCLGLGHNINVQNPTIVQELCSKQVLDIQFGFDYTFALALTATGELYSWGENDRSQLGYKTRDTSKPHCISFFSDKKVLEIKTGHHYSLALTESGDVYAWGNNKDIKMIELQTPDQKIISIANGMSHALALTESGEVYRMTIEYSGGKFDNWLKISFSSRVSKIACGTYHSMILTDDASVYCFGDNTDGECGDGSMGTNRNEETKNIPTKIDASIKFTDIEAVKHLSISFGLSDNGFCYVWGKYSKQSFNKPTVTLFKAINDAIEFYSEKKAMHKPYSINDNAFKNQSVVIMDRIRMNFNQDLFSDIAFKFDSQRIYANKAYLSMVCDHFKVMFADNAWIESKTNEIEITDYSYSVYFAFIKYLYTGLVDIKPEETVELIDLANCYFEEQLKQSCVKLIKSCVTLDNVFEIYSSAIKYKSDELKDHCVDTFHSYMQNKSLAKSILDKFTSK